MSAALTPAEEPALSAERDRFLEVLDEIRALHDRKQTDYGKGDDPFANIRSCEEWGIPPWVGAFIRINDKVHRLKRFAERGTLANESAEDSMLDIAVYALISLVLYREASEEAGGLYRGTAQHPFSGPDPEPQPSDGPEYHAEHAAWVERNDRAPLRAQFPTYPAYEAAYNAWRQRRREATP